MQIARQDADTQMKRIAMRTLANIGDRAALPVFLDALQGKDINLRLQAIDGLAKTQANEAVHPLIELLEDSKGAVRGATARALADLGDEAALEPIRNLLRRAWWRPFMRMRLRLALDRLEHTLGMGR